MRGGWTRMRPHSLTFLLLGVGIAENGATRDDLKRGVRNVDNPEGDLDASCWETPESLDEDEHAKQPAHIQAAERYAAHYGRPPLRTHTDVLDLLMAAGIIYEVPIEAGVPRLYPKVPAPAPAEVFPLDEEEAAIQRQLRIDSAYEGDSYRIIELFEPDGQRPKEVVTSLDRLARLLQGNVHDARETVRLLTEAGDFTTSLDLTDLPSHKVFRIRCDWDRFDEERIGIHGMTEDGRLSVTLPNKLS
ncbi:DUF6042 family protein [Streptomyces sp. NPDC052236]|uniref:DUF6042 family protein n=1 Tax=Streptomyces sp. NPDC052236 TaxID=3365686 RepID=UPI0037D11AE5